MTQINCFTESTLPTNGSFALAIGIQILFSDDAERRRREKTDSRWSKFPLHINDTTFQRPVVDVGMKTKQLDKA